MKILETSIPDLYMVEMDRQSDHRGAFMRWFCDDELSGILRERRIRQINHSLTRSVGAIRGMHFQKGRDAEMKLIRCLQGRVFDVAVDLRKESQTFLNWHAEVLDANEDRMMAIPEGFAHGFQVLAPESELIYLHTSPYAPDAEGALHYADPRIAIDWPLIPTDISVRDQNHPLLGANYEGIAL